MRPLASSESLTKFLTSFDGVHEPNPLAIFVSPVAGGLPVRKVALEIAMRLRTF